jgi:hypothetical protein
MIDEYLETKIDEKVKQRVGEIFSTFQTLPEKYADKVTFSLSDMCEIMGVGDNKSGRERIRKACRSGELPFYTFGQDYVFPRAMVESYLRGEWQQRIQIELKPNVQGLADKLR